MGHELIWPNIAIVVNGVFGGILVLRIIMNTAVRRPLGSNKYSKYSTTYFERSSAIYGHFSLSGLIFHVYFMANLSNVLLGHFSCNFTVTRIHSSHHIWHICPTFSLTSTDKCPWKYP